MVTFENLSMRINKHALLSDFMGIVDEIHEIKSQMMSYGRPNTHQKIRMHDSNNNEVVLTLWGDKSKDFERVVNENKDTIQILVVTSLTVGKTYLWRTIISKLRSDGRIVLTVASSGIASLLLPGGKTAHSRFHIPIALNDSSCCSIKQGSQLAELLKITDLIIWDEAPMVHKHCFEALDRSLRDILRQTNIDAVNKPFGGLAVLLGGDFRQILPVVPKGRREDIVQAAINRSYLWSYCKVFKLSINMRLRQVVCSNVAYFSKWILNVGDGKVKTLVNNDEFDSSNIQIPDYLLVKSEDDPIATIVASTYPNLASNYKSDKYLKERTILATKNEVVDEINSFMLNLIPGTSSTFLSFDSICNSSDRSADWDALYPTEFLNSLRFPGTPNHKLELKVGAPVMLLRNMNPLLGLCNGTRMVVTNIQSWVIEAKIITGTNIGSKHYIPRMVMTPSETKFPFQMKRRQFPLALCFAMTINKSQGQTLEHVGLYLRQSVFCHGQLYVAISRISSPSGLKILVDNDNCHVSGVTQNIVYKKVFNNIS